MKLYLLSRRPIQEKKQNKSLTACSCHPSKFYLVYRRFLRKFVFKKIPLKIKFKIKTSMNNRHQKHTSSSHCYQLFFQVKEKKISIVKKNILVQIRRLENLFYIAIFPCVHLQKYRKRSTKDYYLEKQSVYTQRLETTMGNIVV